VKVAFEAKVNKHLRHTSIQNMDNIPYNTHWMIHTQYYRRDIRKRFQNNKHHDRYQYIPVDNWVVVELGVK
jgi:hypothetical protein